jgi:hypothetical protein
MINSITGYFGNTPIYQATNRTTDAVRKPTGNWRNKMMKSEFQTEAQLIQE